MNKIITSDLTLHQRERNVVKVVAHYEVRMFEPFGVKLVEYGRGFRKATSVSLQFSQSLLLAVSTASGTSHVSILEPFN